MKVFILIHAHDIEVKKDYAVIPDNKIVMLWKSRKTNPEEDGFGEEAEISPDWYEENGTPTDSGGEDMEYIETRLLT